MNPAQRQELEAQLDQGKRSKSAQEELVWREIEAVMDWADNIRYTEANVKRALIAVDNIIIFARQARTKLRRSIR